MSRILDHCGKLIWGGALALAMFAAPGSAHAKGFRVLYAFQGGSDGGNPVAGLIADSSGNLYGTTNLGGTNDDGVVFKLAPDRAETTLHSFAGGSDGANPSSGLVADRHGNLYGTTPIGGSGCNGQFGCGTAFKVAPDGTETVLHAFTSGNDGGAPYAGLIKRGNFYGTASSGGVGFGTVFELARDGTETTLHTFTGSDGASPAASLIADKAGNFYGTTYYGGAAGCLENQGCGTVFKLAPDGTETTLFIFSSENKFGTNPAASLIANKEGNFYGTAELGGDYDACVVGCGVVFELAANGTYTLLYTFTGGRDDNAPVAGLVADGQGNFYGTTYAGGADRKGVVFKLTPDGKETVLHSFTGGSDGANPEAGLIADSKGNLYGTTFTGGNGVCYPAGCGTVFKIAEQDRARATACA